MAGQHFPPAETVRGIVSGFICQWSHLLVPPIVEIGSRRDRDGNWWANLRLQFGFTADDWLGVDMQSGFGVDMVFDVSRSLDEWPGDEDPRGTFRACVCAEVLEHVERPDELLANARRLLCPGGWILITVPFSFPIHNYPDDYWRFTPSGLTLLLERAGFVDIETAALAERRITLYDHDQTPAPRKIPQHVGAVARRPTE